MVENQNVASTEFGLFRANVLLYPMIIKNVTPASTTPENESPGIHVANDALRADARYGNRVT